MRKIILTLAFMIPLNGFSFDFKGVEIGGKSEPQEIFDKLGVECSEAYQSKFICNGYTTIATFRSYMNLVLTEKGYVQRIFLDFDSDGFETVAPLLVEKYGKPKSNKVSQLQNKMGAKFEQHVLFWIDKDENTVTLSRYGSKVDKSILSFSTKMDRDMMKALKGDPAKDI